MIKSLVVTHQADSVVREKYTTHVNWMKCLSGGEAALAAAVPAGSGGGSGPAATRLKELMESVDTVRAEREVIESEVKAVNPDMKKEFLAAAAGGQLNEPAMSVQSLGREFAPLQKQVGKKL